MDRDDQPGLGRLSAYILRPSFAGTRLHYDADNGQIEYRTTKGLTRRMDALDWIALVTSHIPDPHQQMVRYYGRYSNASRGWRRKQTVSAPLKTGIDSAPQPDSPAMEITAASSRLPGILRHEPRDEDFLFFRLEEKCSAACIGFVLCRPVLVTLGMDTN